MTQEFKISENDKVYILILAGGAGARIIQTCFIRSLMKKRRIDNNNYPILVIDNTLIGMMVSQALMGQNVHGIQACDTTNNWPQDPWLYTLKDGTKEHAIFDEQWRNKFNNLLPGQNIGSLHSLIENNWERAYSIEYGFQLTKLIHTNKYKNSKESFICNLYSKVISISGGELEYDGGYPLLKVTQENEEIEKALESFDKPFVLIHYGIDRNSQELMSGINYRTHKIWELQRWQKVIDEYSHKYQFVQVYANQFTYLEMKNTFNIKVESFNNVLQMLQHPKCKFFMSIDNYLPHLASSLVKKGIVLWGSVSPYIWGWKHNLNIWNKASCPDIGCWRPGMFDTDVNGKIWVCPHMNCMKSISVKQVLNNIEELEDILENDKEKEKIIKL